MDLESPSSWCPRWISSIVEAAPRDSTSDTQPRAAVATSLGVSRSARHRGRAAAAIEANSPAPRRHARTVALATRQWPGRGASGEVARACLAKRHVPAGLSVTARPRGGPARPQGCARWSGTRYGLSAERGAQACEAHGAGTRSPRSLRSSANSTAGLSARSTRRPRVPSGRASPIQRWVGRPSTRSTQSAPSATMTRSIASAVR